MLAPASGFYANNSVVNQVRIAYVLDKKHLENAVKCLGSVLEDYPGS